MSQPVETGEKPRNRRPAPAPAPSADAAYLMSENYRYRERIRELKAELKTAQGMAPGENSVVLSGDDAAKYRELKLTPAQIAEKLAQLTTLETEVADLRSKASASEQQSAVQAAAEAAGYDAEVLAEVVKLKGLIVETKEIEKDGAKKKVASVRTAADAEPTELTIYATEHLKPFLRALVKDESDKGQEAQPGAGAEGQLWTEQKAGGRAPAGKQQTDQELETELRSSGNYFF
jgi:hypothetical protein